jgi:hypothetical protein
MINASWMDEMQLKGSNVIVATLAQLFFDYTMQLQVNLAKNA